MSDVMFEDKTRTHFDDQLGDQVLGWSARNKLEISAAVSRKSLSADPSPLSPERLALFSSAKQLKLFVESDRARLENLQSKR